ncbi:MAG: alkane 1-monooxygenase [Ignavibacteriaceae bacterium]|nr:alkane 1-monooxygenase [Ignavibacteriaceae bacterium]
MIYTLRRLLPYALSFTVPFLTLAGLFLGGWAVWLTVITVFVIVPVLELIMRNNGSNVPEYLEDTLRSGASFTGMLLLHLPLHYIIVWLFLETVSKNHYSPAELTGLLLSTAISLGGIGITVAHELIHRPQRWLKLAGELLLLPVLYIHFTIEHVRGHHKHVGTHRDPATAFYGEHIFGFWIKSVTGSYRSAWELELARLKKSGKGFFSLSNAMIFYTLATAGFFGGIYLLYGSYTFLLFLLTAVVSFTLLEIVNYIEHYGLERMEKEPGRFEKVEMHHSWNSNTYISRYFLFELTRHSDHHMNAAREYQILRDMEESPRHPTGYPGMILLALIPSLWRRVMDPLVEKFAVKRQ